MVLNRDQLKQVAQSPQFPLVIIIVLIVVLVTGLLLVMGEKRGTEPKSLEPPIVKSPEEVVPRFAVGGEILNIDENEKTIRVKSHEDGGELIIRVTDETKINIVRFTFEDSDEPLPSLKFDDLKTGYKISVLTVETDPGLSEVTAREVRVTSIL